MLVRKRCPSEKALCLVKANHMVGNVITTQEKQVLETKINMLDTKIIVEANSSNMEAQQRRVNTSLVDL